MFQNLILAENVKLTFQINKHEQPMPYTMLGSLQALHPVNLAFMKYNARSCYFTARKQKTNSYSLKIRARIKITGITITPSETGHGVDPGGERGWRAEGAGGDFHSSVSVSWAWQRITRESSWMNGHKPLSHTRNHFWQPWNQDLEEWRSM